MRAACWNKYVENIGQRSNADHFLNNPTTTKKRQLSSNCEFHEPVHISMQ